LAQALWVKPVSPSGFDLFGGARTSVATRHPASMVYAGGLVEVPRTADVSGNAVGARVPPSCLAKCCFPSCAISGYETGDPLDGCCQGKACCALILELLCCLGCLVSLLCWRPDPANIKGDGTQRTMNNKCLAGCCLGYFAIAFWESGDFCCTPDGRCTWIDGDTFMGCILHWVPYLLGFGPLDSCYVCCCWVPDPKNFKRSTLNHGGGAPLSGAPVQMSGPHMMLMQVQQGMAWAAQPAVVGQPVAAQRPVVAGAVVAPSSNSTPSGYEMPK